jgi:single-strand DNA-binding protein
MSINKVILIGHVGKDPTIRKTQNGKSIASFSLATTESWKNKNTGDYEKKTEWHNVVILAEGLSGMVEKVVKKGTHLYIEGTLRNRSYEKDGQTKYITEIALQGYNSKLVILNSKDSSDRSSEDRNYNDSNSNSDSGYNPANQFSSGDFDGVDDDIPF